MRGVKHSSEEARLAAILIAKKSYEERNKEKISKKKAEWYAKNKDRLKPIRLLANKKHYELHRGLRIAYVRERQGRLRFVDGLSLAHQAEIDGMYQFCRIFKGFEVDHIIPLNGKNVSGLHVPANLQVLTAIENRKKGNKYAEQ